MLEPVKTASGQRAAREVIDKPTDCVLFIDEQMAKLIIAWQRCAAGDNDPVLAGTDIHYAPAKLALALGYATGQVMALIQQALAVGVIERDGGISPVALKVVNKFISEKIQDFAGR